MIQAPKGTHDIYGDEMRLWRRVEDEIRALTGAYGYAEIRTPLFESTDLFLRGVGDTSDIVQKEMYTFNDKGGRSLSLRPELTAGVARAYIERGMHNAPQPTKLFYIGPCFRYENPQAGRYRQHYQFGVEVFGADTPAAEAEIISMGNALQVRLGIGGVTLHINSIGCADCRGSYYARLNEYLKISAWQEGAIKPPDALCDLCKKRFFKTPLRILDCKNPSCHEVMDGAPNMLEILCADCDRHFNQLQKLLDAFNIPFTINNKIVRGMDYYTRTVFEFIKDDGQTVIGGGRYDGLISRLGGTATGGVGFGMGMERLVSLLRQNAATDKAVCPKLFIGHADAEGFAAACVLANELRLAGVRAECDLPGRSVKAQMKYADKINAQFTTVLGATELVQAFCTLKNMQTGEQIKMDLSKLKEWAVNP
jgi:histidyl-tRNA synthetase